MGGAYPGPASFAAFVGVKFGGYCLAGWTLRKLESGVSARVVTIAATRTGIGILAGPLTFFASMWAVARFNINIESTRSMIFGIYVPLFILRVIVWGFVVWLFCRRPPIDMPRLLKYAGAGAVWSCILDLVGISLALIAPGRITVC